MLNMIHVQSVRPHVIGPCKSDGIMYGRVRQER